MSDDCGVIIMPVDKVVNVIKNYFEDIGVGINHSEVIYHSRHRDRGNTALTIGPVTGHPDIHFIIDIYTFSIDMDTARVTLHALALHMHEYAPQFEIRFAVNGSHRETNDWIIVGATSVEATIAAALTLGIEYPQFIQVIGRKK